MSKNEVTGTMPKIKSKKPKVYVCNDFNCGLKHSCTNFLKIAVLLRGFVKKDNKRCYKGNVKVYLKFKIDNDGISTDK